jgi:2-polyprenyl-3-methyl-5-hydroxy-6-metoxy-1,4-benzoquinol methylase
MPFSQSSQLSTIVGFFESRQPKSVLDVGTGMGQYGFLLRNNLEQTGLFVVEGASGRQARKDEWNVRIDGIEGCEAYHTAVHDYAYNTMFWGEALAVLQRLPSRGYEAVMAIDILEHLDKPQGIRFLEELKRVASGFVLVSTPKDFHAQTVEANPLENHRSVWSAQELAAAGFDHILENGESWIVVHTA